MEADRMDRCDCCLKEDARHNLYRCNGCTRLCCLVCCPAKGGVNDPCLCVFCRSERDAAKLLKAPDRLLEIKHVAEAYILGAKEDLAEVPVNSVAFGNADGRMEVAKNLLEMYDFWKSEDGI